MKRIMFIAAMSFFIFSCQSKSDQGAEERNSTDHVEATTEENRSPNLQNEPDTGSRLYVDTVSSAESVNRERQGADSLELKTDE